MSAIIVQGLRSTNLITQGYRISIPVSARFLLLAARNRFAMIAMPCRFILRAGRGG